MCLHVVDDTFVVWKPSLNNGNFLTPIEIHISALKCIITYSETKMQLSFHVEAPLYAVTDITDSWNTLEISVEFFKSSESTAFKNKISDIIRARGFPQPEEKAFSDVKMSVTKSIIKLDDGLLSAGKSSIIKLPPSYALSSSSPIDTPVKHKMSVTRTPIHISDQTPILRNQVPSFHTSKSALPLRQKLDSLDDDFWDFPDYGDSVQKKPISVTTHKSLESATTTPLTEKLRRKKETPRKKKGAEEEVNMKDKKAQETSNKKRKDEDVARKKRVAEEAARKKKNADEVAEKKKEAEEIVRKKKEEEIARKKEKAEELARKKKEAEDLAKKKKKAEAAKKKKEAKEAAERAAEKRKIERERRAARKAEAKRVAEEKAKNEATKEKALEEDLEGRQIEEAKVLTNKVSTKEDCNTEWTENQELENSKHTTEPELHLKGKDAVLQLSGPDDLTCFSEKRPLEDSGHLVSAQMFSSKETEYKQSYKESPGPSEGHETRAFKRQRTDEPISDHEDDLAFSPTSKQPCFRSASVILGSDDPISLSMDESKDMSFLTSDSEVLGVKDDSFKNPTGEGFIESYNSQVPSQDIRVYSSRFQDINTIESTPVNTQPLDIHPPVTLQEMRILDQDGVDVSVRKREVVQMSPLSVRSQAMLPIQDSNKANNPPGNGKSLSAIEKPNPYEQTMVEIPASRIHNSSGKKSPMPEKSTGTVSLSVAHEINPALRSPQPAERKHTPERSNPTLPTTSVPIPYEAIPVQVSQLGQQRTLMDVTPPLISTTTPRSVTFQGSVRNNFDDSVTLLDMRMPAPKYSEEHLSHEPNETCYKDLRPSRQADLLPWERSQTQLASEEKFKVLDSMITMRSQTHSILKEISKSLVRKLELIETEVLDYEEKFGRWFEQAIFKAEQSSEGAQRALGNLSVTESDRIETSQASIVAWIKQLK